MSQKYRFRVEHDELFTPETPEGKPLPGTEEDYDKNPIHALIDPDDDPQKGARRVMLYEEYCLTYGNPDNHRALMVSLESQCPCCKAWNYVEGLSGIDFVLGAPELADEGKVVDTPGELTGYLQTVARELIDEEASTS